MPTASSLSFWQRPPSLLWLAVILISAGGCSGNLAVPHKQDDPNDYWDVYLAQGSRTGYMHTRVRPVIENGRQLVQIDGQTTLAVTRSGQENRQKIETVSIETPEGELVRFETKVAFGRDPVEFVGRVESNALVLDTKTAGKISQVRMPWPGGVQGFQAEELTLRRAPLRPGEQRQFKMLLPVFNQVGEVEMVAGDWEETHLLDRSQRLLRVESTVRLPDKSKLTNTLWMAETGDVLKSRTTAMQQESYRTSAAVAQAAPQGKPLDLVADTVIKVGKRLDNPHSTRRIRYRVELEGEDPTEVFSSGSTQSVKSLGPHTAEINVEAYQAGQHPASSDAQAAPTLFDVQPNDLLQSDDREVQAMAREGAGGNADSWGTALALERYVYRTITKKNFSQAFASAAEVARSREGDCTEHAVLLAALCRANRIPARVAIGLVYVDKPGGFGYHMWTEAYVNGTWVPLDATLGRGGIGAAHLKLTTSDLQGVSAFSSFLPVARVLGRLKIEILEVE